MKNITLIFSAFLIGLVFIVDARADDLLRASRTGLEKIKIEKLDPKEHFKRIDKNSYGAGILNKQRVRSSTISGNEQLNKDHSRTIVGYQRKFSTITGNERLNYSNTRKLSGEPSQLKSVTHKGITDSQNYHVTRAVGKTKDTNLNTKVMGKAEHIRTNALVNDSKKFSPVNNVEILGKRSPKISMQAPRLNKVNRINLIGN